MTKSAEISSVDTTLEQIDQINVLGARVHNLKNIDVSIPRNRLIVITGLSGSGKSSLAFDTIYAEGQRRYIETLSAYARQFLGGMERPDVDKITGLSPVISIEQKTTNKNPRSTVGTITEIFDFLRLLYARAGVAYSYRTGKKMVKYTDEQIVSLIGKQFVDLKIMILSPVVKGRKGHYKELFEQIRRKGYLYVRADGEIKELFPGMKLDRYKTHFIEMVIDKLKVEKSLSSRLKDSVQTAMSQGQGTMMVLDMETNDIRFFSRKLMCPDTGISYNEPAPHTFSFNSPQGACPLCNGLGTMNEVDVQKIMPDPSLSIRKGGILPLGTYRNSLIFWQLEALAAKYNFSLDTPVGKIPGDAVQTILHGSEESFKLLNTPLGSSSNYFLSFEGIINFVNNLHSENGYRRNHRSSYQFIKKITCPECAGLRLRKESLFFRIGSKNIAELASMDIGDLYDWFLGLEKKLTARQKLIAAEILKEISGRLKFLLNVGLDYLSLDRTARSLSAGESQRIRLATQIGSQLVNVLYILDEPSIGLHQRDNKKLIHALKELRDSGNSVIVVEHDKEMILSSDHVVDMGPFAGRHGGEVVAQGTPKEILKFKTLTAEYLNRIRKIPVPEKRRKQNSKYLFLKGASGNNLKNVSVKFPLGNFICVTGVSGSGKSSLVNQTLHPVPGKTFL